MSQENLLFAHAKTKTQISCTVTMQLTSAFFFCYIVQFLYLSKSEISSLQPSSVAVQPVLCGTWTETLKASFHTPGHKWSIVKSEQPGHAQDQIEGLHCQHEETYGPHILYSFPLSSSKVLLDRMDALLFLGA